MSAIYKLTYEAVHHVPGVRGTRYTFEDTLEVSSKGDAEAAIAKGKKHVLRSTWVGEYGAGKKTRKVKYVCKSFLLIAVERLALADI